MGTKTFAVFKRIPQDCISGSADEWQTEQLSGRYREEQARERFEIIVEQMKQVQGITEQLKVDNTWEWVGRMNNIQACAREIVERDNLPVK